MLWAINSSNNKRLYPIEDTIGMYPERICSTASQEILIGLKTQRLWLVCDCCSPSPVMFIRKGSNGYLTLVNHSERGKHDFGCPFYSSVKGEPRSAPGQRTQHANHSAKVSLYNGFSNGSTITSSTSTTPSGTKTINGLVRLVWQLANDSYSQVYDGEPKSVQAVFSSWINASKIFTMASGLSLSAHIYAGASGYEQMCKKLKKLHKDDPHTRHQALLLLDCEKIDYSKETLTVIDHNGDFVIIYNVDKASIKVNKIGLNYNQQLLAMAFTFDSPDDDEVRCHRWVNLICLSLENAILLHTLYEKVYCDLILHGIEALERTQDVQCTLTKPTLSYIKDDTGELYQPNFVIQVNSGEHREFEIGVIIQDGFEVSAVCTMEETRALSEELYDQVLLLEPQKFESAEELKDDFETRFKSVTSVLVVKSQEEC